MNDYTFSRLLDSPPLFLGGSIVLDSQYASEEFIKEEEKGVCRDLVQQPWHTPSQKGGGSALFKGHFRTRPDRSRVQFGIRLQTRFDDIHGVGQIRANSSGQTTYQQVPRFGRDGRKSEFGSLLPNGFEVFVRKKSEDCVGHISQHLRSNSTGGKECFEGQITHGFRHAGVGLGLQFLLDNFVGHPRGARNRVSNGGAHGNIQSLSLFIRFGVPLLKGLFAERINSKV